MNYKKVLAQLLSLTWVWHFLQSYLFEIELVLLSYVNFLLLKKTEQIFYFMLHLSLVCFLGFNRETIELHGLYLDITDVGGSKKLIPLWPHYCYETKALIYVIDSSDEAKFKESFEQLQVCCIAKK